MYIKIDDVRKFQFQSREINDNCPKRSSDSSIKTFCHSRLACLRMIFLRFSIQIFVAMTGCENRHLALISFFTQRNRRHHFCYQNISHRNYSRKYNWPVNLSQSRSHFVIYRTFLLLADEIEDVENKNLVNALRIPRNETTAEVRKINGQPTKQKQLFIQA